MWTGRIPPIEQRSPAAHGKATKHCAASSNRSFPPIVAPELNGFSGRRAGKRHISLENY